MNRAQRTARLEVDGTTLDLGEQVDTPWVRLGFRAAPGVRLHGIARFRLTTPNADVGLYMTPIHIDPERPAMPISQPPVFAIHLAKLLGPFATLGLAEDSWAMSEGVLDERGWLDQAYAFHDERRRIWFHTLERLRRGMAVCVFDLPDRLQHMFFRHLEPDHPAQRGRPASPHRNAVEEMYLAMDTLVGETAAHAGRDSALFVISDHGFKSFRRGVNLNAWLVAHGWMTLKPGAGPGEYLQSVDWSRTKAYAIGLGNIYVNLRGRERLGSVERADVPELKREIIASLRELRDHDGAPALRRVIDVQQTFRGPYTDDGPELIPGFHEGYRVSWDCARGAVGQEVFEDNVRAWSGDHCMDPEIVPGVLFSNVPLPGESPRLMDIGPTVLDLLGVDVPKHMMGRSLA